MLNRAAISFSAAAISKACARLSSAHGPAIKASGSLLPKRTLPTATTAFGPAVFGVMAGDHEGHGGSGQPASLHRGKCRRPQERALDIGDDRATRFALVARLVPGRIGLKYVPYPLALGERFPSKHVMQVLAALADQHGPKAGLLDTVLGPDFKRVLLEPLEQRRQPAGDAGVDALFVDHGFLPMICFSDADVRRPASLPSVNLHGAGNRQWMILHQPALLHRSPDEGREQRVWREGARFQLGVELHADEPGMVVVFDDLRQ